VTTLVLGASGFVGRSLVDALVTDGEPVRAASRRPRAAPAAGARVESVVCDLEKPVLTQVGRLRGRRVPMVRVPILTPRLSALWLKLVTGADYAIARELVLGLAEDLLPESDRYWELIGHTALVSFEAAARHALETETPPALAARIEEGLVERVGRAAERLDSADKPSRP
jgi:hypothetical protein